MPSGKPALIKLNSLEDYKNRIRQEYNGKTINTPEGFNVKFFLSSDKDCEHAVCGKDKNSIHFFRAKRILWIKYVLQESSIRLVKRSLKNNYIVFISPSLKYCVVCMSRDDYLKFVTHYGELNGNQINDYNDPDKYVDYP